MGQASGWGPVQIALSQARLDGNVLAATVDDAIFGRRFSHSFRSEILDDEQGPTAAGFWHRAHAWFCVHGITIERAITDNGSCYRSFAWRDALAQTSVAHKRTRPYRPQTNGKAERLIRTMLAGWAYGALYRNSSERAAALDGWLHYYNHQRPHSALGRKPPIARLNERTNLLGCYS